MLDTKTAHIGIDISPLLSPKTGVGYYVDHLVHCLVRLGAELRWSLFIMPGRKLPRIDLGLTTNNCYIVTRRWPLPARYSNLLLQFPWQKIITVEGFLGRVDLFHSTNFLCLSQKWGKRVITVHDMSFFLFPEFHPLKRTVLFKQLFPSSLEMANHVIAVSEHTKQDLIKHFHLPPKKITVTHLAAGDKFHPVCREEAQTVIPKYGLSYGQYLLYVGALEPRKNLVRLLRAYELFRAEESSSIPLVLAGASGWLNREFYRRLERSVWKKDIKVLGYIPESDLPALYSGALLFVYPSIYEGFGLPVLEAMACGTPVVTSNNSSLPEVTGDAAILVDPLKIEEITEALVRIAGDFTLREEMREKGLRQARLFSWEDTARKTIQVYEKTLGEPCKG